MYRVNEIVGGLLACIALVIMWPVCVCYEIVCRLYRGDPDLLNNEYVKVARYYACHPIQIWKELWGY